MDSKVPPIFFTTHVKVGDYTLGVRRSKNQTKRTIILIHGIGASEKYYRPLATELVRDYSVISLTLPGYGDTKRLPLKRTLSLDGLAEIVVTYIRQQKIINPVVVGHSMGCQVVARLGARHELTTSKLILMSPTINRKERTAPLQLFRLLEDTLREPLAVNILIFKAYLKFGFLRYLITQRYMIADRMEDQLKDCAQPILILRGEKDKIVPEKWTQFLLETLQNGEVTEIINAPHNLQYTHPKKVAQLCTNFIED